MILFVALSECIRKTMYELWLRFACGCMGSVVGGKAESLVRRCGRAASQARSVGPAVDATAL